MKKKHKRQFDFLQLIKKTWGYLYSLTFIFLIVIAGLVVLSAFDVPVSYEFLVVQSGSMEPAIKKGSIVVIKPQGVYEKGEVITVAEPTDQEISVTHRIYDIEEKDGEIFYVTKGDANESVDTEKRPKKNVIGKVLFSIPYLGFLVSFAKTRDGLITLIMIPATIIVYSELMKVKDEILVLLKKKKEKEQK